MAQAFDVMTSTVVSRMYGGEGTVVQELIHGGYAVEVLPERGARVVSLRHGSHGEWLADSRRGWPTTPPTQWADGDVRGWDECLPNVAQSVHPDLGTPLADHGEVWNRAWDWQPTPTGTRTRISGALLPFEFQRILGLSGSGISARYRFENVSDTAYSIGWAMHLLLRGEPSNLTLDAEVPVRVDSLFRLDDVRLPTGWMPWGELTMSLPMSMTGWAAKVFTQPGATTSVSLNDDRGELTVTISDAPVAATFGLWINAWGWPANHPVAHIGVEPGFGDRDVLGDAVAAGSALHAEPNTPYTWKVSLHAE